MIVDVGTRYIIEHREPHLGEWIMYPGPIYTFLHNPQDVALSTVCTVLIGTLSIGLDDTGKLVYDVKPMPQTFPDVNTPAYRPLGTFPTA